MMSVGWRALAACGVCLGGLAEAYVRPRRYLLISSPTTHNVYYAETPSLHDLTQPLERRQVLEAKVLIDGLRSRCSGSFCYEDSDRGLRRPSGIAIKQGCGSAVLYVSDNEAKDIFAYELSESGLGFLQVGPQRRVRQGIAGEVEWLAVDGLGNLFLSSPQSGQVETITQDSLFHTSNLSEPATVLHEASQSPAVAGPAGVASDGFFVYWANQNGDSGRGTIARGAQRPAAAAQHQPEPLAVGGGPYEAMATNLCLARDNVFFTGGTSALLAAKLDAGAGNVTEVARDFVQPLGCTYDGESTLYVADGGDNAIYSLPANMVQLRPVRRLAKVIAVQQPNQLAVFSGATSGHCPLSSMPSSATTTGHFALLAAVLVAGAVWPMHCTL